MWSQTGVGLLVSCWYRDWSRLGLKFAKQDWIRILKNQSPHTSSRPREGVEMVVWSCIKAFLEKKTAGREGVNESLQIPFETMLST